MIKIPSGPITPLGARVLQEGIEPEVGYISANRGVSFALMGAEAPIPGVQDGVTIQSIKGLMPIWQTKDQQGANQDGVTFQGAVYDPMVVDMACEMHGTTPQAARKVIRRWIESWDVKAQGELFTRCDNAYWYAPVRWFKTPTESLMRAASCRQKFTWTARADDGFWRSFDSVSEFAATGTAAGFNTVTNIGDQEAFCDHVVYGPFDQVQIANGPGGSPVTFGPLLQNQIVLLRTEPRRRGVYDLTIVPPPGQPLNLWQNFLKSLISFALNNNIPPLLQEFESLFGILPPQAELYSLLGGRFTNSIPAKEAGADPVSSQLAVKIVNGGTGAKIVTSITPRRRYPF